MPYSYLHCGKGMNRMNGTKMLLRKRGAMKNEKTVIYISADSMGRGSEELGRLLVRNFLYTVNEGEAPWRIIFINSGVQLAVNGSEVMGTLNQIEVKGTEILSCGTCLDYFGLKTELAAGRVSNMSEILDSLTKATKIISP